MENYISKKKLVKRTKTQKLKGRKTLNSKGQKVESAHIILKFAKKIRSILCYLISILNMLDK